MLHNVCWFFSLSPPQTPAPQLRNLNSFWHCQFTLPVFSLSTWLLCSWLPVIRLWLKEPWKHRYILNYSPAKILSRSLLPKNWSSLFNLDSLCLSLYFPCLQSIWKEIFTLLFLRCCYYKEVNLAEINNVLLYEFCEGKDGSVSTNFLCTWELSYWDTPNSKDYTVHLLPFTNLKTQNTK